MQSSSQSEGPLSGHPQYQFVVALNNGPGPVTQVAWSRSSNELISIKFLPRGWTEAELQLQTRSALLQKSLGKHPHLVELKEILLLKDYVGLVHEYVEGDTLENFLEKAGGKLAEGFARFIWQQLLVAVDYCHRRMKLLRDIKLSNVVLSISPGQMPIVKLCDFAASKDINDLSKDTSELGSILFSAPEVITKDSRGSVTDGRAADIWSCGIILYVMIFGRHPFIRDQDVTLNQNNKLLAILQRTMANDIEYPKKVLDELTPECVDLLHFILRVDPLERMNMQQLLSHPWLLEGLPQGALMLNNVIIAKGDCMTVDDINALKTLLIKGSMTEEECRLWERGLPGPNQGLSRFQDGSSLPSVSGMPDNFGSRGRDRYEAGGSMERHPVNPHQDPNRDVRMGYGHTRQPHAPGGLPGRQNSEIMEDMFQSISNLDSGQRQSGSPDGDAELLLSSTFVQEFMAATEAGLMDGLEDGSNGKLSSLFVSFSGQPTSQPSRQGSQDEASARRDKDAAAKFFSGAHASSSQLPSQESLWGKVCRKISQDMIVTEQGNERAPQNQQALEGYMDDS